MMRLTRGWLVLTLAAIPLAQSNAQRPDSARATHREPPLFGQVRQALRQHPEVQLNRPDRTQFVMLERLPSGVIRVVGFESTQREMFLRGKGTGRALSWGVFQPGQAARGIVRYMLVAASPSADRSRLVPGG